MSYQNPPTHDFLSNEEKLNRDKSIKSNNHIDNQMDLTGAEHMKQWQNHFQQNHFQQNHFQSNQPIPYHLSINDQLMININNEIQLLKYMNFQYSQKIDQLIIHNRNIQNESINLRLTVNWMSDRLTNINDTQISQYNLLESLVEKLKTTPSDSLRSVEPVLGENISNDSLNAVEHDSHLQTVLNKRVEPVFFEKEQYEDVDKNVVKKSRRWKRRVSKNMNKKNNIHKSIDPDSEPNLEPNIGQNIGPNLESNSDSNVESLKYSNEKRHTNEEIDRDDEEPKKRITIRFTKNPQSENETDKDEKEKESDIMGALLLGGILNSIMGGGNDMSTKNQVDKTPNKKQKDFEHIIIPDMKKEIKQEIILDKLDGFEEIDLSTMDLIINKGKEFIEMVNNANSLSKGCDYCKGNEDNMKKKEKKIINITGKPKRKDEGSMMENLLNMMNNTPDVLADEENKTKKITINDVTEQDEDGLYLFFEKRYSVNPRKLMKLVKPIELLDSMVGMKEVKNDLHSFISRFLHNEKPTGMLNTAIYGKSGCGKTDLGKILCMIYSALEIIPSERFKIIKATDLMGQHVGETKHKTKKCLDEANGGVLFIDEAYSLTNSQIDRASYGKECIDTLNQELSDNRRNLIVIIAGYEREIEDAFFKINEGLNRRFPFRYKIGEYSEEQLKDIMLRMIRIQNISLDKSITNSDLIELFNDKQYFENSGGDIENFLEKCIFVNNKRSLGKHPKMRNILTLKDLTQGLELFKNHKKIEQIPYSHMYV